MTADIKHGAGGPGLLRERNLASTIPKPETPRAENSGRRSFVQAWA